jgi:hypothetical protein
LKRLILSEQNPSPHSEDEGSDMFIIDFADKQVVNEELIFLDDGNIVDRLYYMIYEGVHINFIIVDRSISTHIANRSSCNILRNVFSLDHLYFEDLPSILKKHITVRNRGTLECLKYIDRGFRVDLMGPEGSYGVMELA